MVSSEQLLEMLCGLRRICYAVVTPDWRVLDVGGAVDDWPRLGPDTDLREAIPEIGERIAEIESRSAADERFVLRWLQRRNPQGRERYYELVLHSADDGAARLCWLIDRSAYGRLKVRIDRHYQKLVGERKSDPETDPFAHLDPDITR